MNQDKQPEALQIASWIKYEYPDVAGFLVSLHAESEQHLQELRSYRITVENREARIAELEAQLIAEAARTAEQKLRACQLEQELEAVGAGGVQPLQKTVAASACSGCGSCKKQCQSKESQAQAATVFNSAHSMSHHTSKGALLRAALAENERLKQGQANLCQFFAEVCNALEDVAQGWQDRAIGTTTQRAVVAIRQLAAQAKQGGV